MTLARENGLHIMTVHHTTKRQTEDPRDATLGSQAINGAVDTILTLQENNGNRVISTAQRYGVGLQQTSLIWDSTNRRMSLGGAFEVTDARSNEQDGEAIRQHILDTLADNPNSETEEIRGRVNVKAATLHAGLQNLLQSGRIIRAGKGLRGDSYKYTIAEIPQENLAS